MTNQPSPNNASKHRMGVHVGRMIMIAADRYRSLPLTINEGVQNAIDAEAKNIFIGVDQIQRVVYILDDGNGASEEQFHAAMHNIGETRKDDKKIGRFGLGVVSPINKCDTFSFISRPDGRGRFKQWNMDRKIVAADHDGTFLSPSTTYRLPNLPVSLRAYAGGMGCIWNTMVSMTNLLTDRATNDVDIDALEGIIRTKLGVFIRQLGINCYIVVIDRNSILKERMVKPLTFTGDPIPLYYRTDDDAGRVEIELYRAVKRPGSGRKGEVIVTEMDTPYGVGWHQFRTQALGLKWASASPVFEVLASGYFEGIIRCEKLELNTDRDVFRQSDALMGLYIALDTWYHVTGQKYYEAEKEQSRDERYNRLAIQVMDEVRDLLRRPEFEALARQFLSSVHQGRIGTNHGVEGKEVIGEDDGPSTRTGQGGVGVPRKPRGQVIIDEGPKPKGKTRDGDIPTGVLGRGTKKHRALVKDDSIGLWIAITDLEHSSRLWEFDINTGAISFNTRHHLWTDVDAVNLKRRTTRHDRQIMHLQKYIILEVLQLLRSPYDEFEERRIAVDEKTPPYIAMFITA